MPYFVYKIDVEREPKNGEVVVLSDGVIIQGGDEEYPEYNPAGTYVRIALITFYTTAGERISSKAVLIVCPTNQQSEYYPIKE